VVERVITERRTIWVGDIASAAGDDFPRTKANAERLGYRGIATTPMFRSGVLVGALSIWRAESRPFTRQQIALLETFADQAHIAIENARLFRELQERQRELEERNTALAESLEQQTATSDILRAIAASPADLDR